MERQKKKNTTRLKVIIRVIKQERTCVRSLKINGAAALRPAGGVNNSHVKAPSPPHLHSHYLLLCNEEVFVVTERGVHRQPHHELSLR